MEFSIDKNPLNDDEYNITLRNGNVEFLTTVTLSDVVKIANEASYAADYYTYDDEPDPYDDDDGLTDAQADAMTLASAGWGTDEDYGYAEDVY